MPWQQTATAPLRRNVGENNRNGRSRRSSRRWVVEVVGIKTQRVFVARALAHKRNPNLTLLQQFYVCINTRYVFWMVGRHRLAFGQRHGNVVQHPLSNGFPVEVAGNAQGVEAAEVLVLALSR